MTMKVTVIDRDLQARLWGNGYQSINQVLVTRDISDSCPQCGQPRGTPHLERYCEDDEWYSVSRWENPCGHLDTYKTILDE
jgi:hypothetical protein